MKKELKEEIISKAKLCKNRYDSFSIELGGDKGLFVQVDYENVAPCEFKKAYFIELNDIYEGDWEPCGEYNAYSSFGNIDLLLDVIDKYLSNHGIIA